MYCNGNRLTRQFFLWAPLVAPRQLGALECKLADRPMARPLASTCFAFEAEFTVDLRCIPMAVRRQLDLAEAEG